ncbi:MAG TPA: SDR family oxidoreductase, partial [Opitutaceae bacterium]
MRLKDKVILVTGSTTGIGEGMVRLFSREGAHVVVHGTREDAARKIAGEIVQGEHKASWVVGDLADPAVPAQMISSVVEQCGRINGLVNNAASMTRGTLETTTLENFNRTIAVNLRAPFLLIQSALPHFRRLGGGKVINIGSVNAYSGERNQCAYSMSKGGLMTLTRNVADAYGAEGLRINQ